MANQFRTPRIEDKQRKEEQHVRNRNTNNNGANKFRETQKTHDIPPAKEPQTKERDKEHTQPRPEPDTTANSGNADTRQEQTDKPSKLKAILEIIAGGEILHNKMTLKQIPLILLILVYLIIIVANRYYVESLTKERQQIEERVNYLKEHQIQLQKSYQETIKISAIAHNLDSIGVGLTATPPYEL